MLGDFISSSVCSELQVRAEELYRTDCHASTSETIDEDDADDACVREGLLSRGEVGHLLGVLSFQRHIYLAHEEIIIYIYIYIYIYISGLRHYTCTDAGKHQHAAIHGHTAGQAM